MSDTRTSHTTSNPASPPWAGAFLVLLRAGETVDQASIAAGVTRAWAYMCRGRDARFRADWQAAVEEGRCNKPDWRQVFLDGLRNGSTVVSACAAAGVAHRTAYLTRRSDRNFANAWREARRTPGSEDAA